MLIGNIYMYSIIQPLIMCLPHSSDNHVFIVQVHVFAIRMFKLLLLWHHDYIRLPTKTSVAALCKQY